MRDLGWTKNDQPQEPEPEGEGPMRMAEVRRAVRVSSADLTPSQIAESQAGRLGRWICEDSLGFVEFDSQEAADAVLVAALWSGSFAEVTVAQADAAFRCADRVGLSADDVAALQRIKARILQGLP